jgi:8-oxo-dGTP pyrophosphatase MutT (NUDIX family)
VKAAVCDTLWKEKMRQRNSARLLVINPEKQVLLFNFQHKGDALDGQSHWATPGGGLEPGESFETAAVRELFEETGLCVANVGESIAERSFSMMLPSGETVLSFERYFVVHTDGECLSREGWTAHEVRVMADHKWWSVAELQTTRETVWPEQLIGMLESAGAAGAVECNEAAISGIVKINGKRSQPSAAPTE